MALLSTQRISSLLVLAFLSSAALALAADALNPPLTNWSAPATWSPHGTGQGITTMGDATNPRPFIGVTPCRQYDSRSTTALATGTNRTITVTGAPCGIPSQAEAVSLNITIFDITGAVGNGVFQVGTAAPPTTAWINYPSTETQRGNAGSLPLPLVVGLAQGGGSVDFTVDVNGYYSRTLGDPTHFFELDNNSSSYTVRLDNASTSCAGPCGLYATVGHGNAVQGSTTGATSIGVLGHSAIYNGVWAESTTWDALAAFGGRDGGYLQGARHGVVGQSLATANNTYGVAGGGASSTIYSAAVFGNVTQSPSNAGYFLNNGNGINTFLATSYLGTDYAVESNGAINGTALYITGLPKNFVAPHPLDPSKEIRYASVEAPTVDVYFRGTATLANGYARIAVPDHFQLTAREGTYMTTLTPVGQAVSLAVVSEGPEGIVVRGSGSTRFHYVVYAERAEIEGYEPVVPNVHFRPETLEKVGLLKTLPPSTKALLVKNGTLNPDFSYNLDTARAMGWEIPDSASKTTAPW